MTAQATPDTESCGCSGAPSRLCDVCLVEWLKAPGMAGLVAEPALEAPWLWDLGEVRQLVYALTFQRVAH